MNKRKNTINLFVLLAVSVVISLLLYSWKIGNESKSLKLERGERIQANLLHAFDVVYYAKKENKKRT
jgi:hypothetical protein